MSATEIELVHITVILPAGRLPLDIMAKAQELAVEHNLEVFFTNAQNLRLLNIPADKVEEIKAPLAELGASFKKKGTFPKPRICVGAPHCNLGNCDSKELSDAILGKFASREHTKPKFKISIAGCPVGCSDPRTTDIGIITTKKGFDLYLGGKGGSKPAVGLCVQKGLSQDELLDALATVVEYHDANTEKKNRIAGLMANEDFPFKVVAE